MFWRSHVTASLTALVLQSAVSATPIPSTSSSYSVALRKPTRHHDTSSKALLSKRAGSTDSTQLISAEQGAGYAIDIRFGGQTFAVIFDTGSSDLWLPQSTFKCVSPEGEQFAQQDCAFGPLYSGDFQDGQVSNENFNITYGDGEFLTGNLGYEDVSIGSITVNKQEVALVNYGFWEGDGQTSGLIGFAYPALTSAFEGSNPAVDNVNTNEVAYNPWIFNAVDQGLLSDPLFTLALERASAANNNTVGGQLTLGDVPDTFSKSTFATTPLKIVNLADDVNAAKNYSYYTIIPDGFTIQSNSDLEEEFIAFLDLFPAFAALDHSASSSATPAQGPESINNTTPVIVDSGTTLMYLPNSLAVAVNKAFDPPSVYIESEGVYENDCSATPPRFGIVIGGQTFYVNSQDLLLTGASGEDPNTNDCTVGVQPGSPGPYILGDTFLKNVVAVFDIGNEEMRFAPHNY